MELLVGMLGVMAILVALAAIRVSHIATWRAVVMVAMSTGSLKACIEFIRYCERF